LATLFALVDTQL